MTNYEFHPWEIWNGGECPCPDEMVQVQLFHQDRKQAENNLVCPAAGKSRTAYAPFAWDWTEPVDTHGRIIAFRRVKKPETVTLYGASYFSVWGFKRDPWEFDTHKLTFNVDSEGNPYNFKCERIK